MISTERIQEIADAVAAVPGVTGVVLGGSRARGDHVPASDVDLGVYYTADLDLPAMQRLAHDIGGEAVQLAVPGSWGPWVNGGAWLQVDGTALDWILRDLDRVIAQWQRALRGEYAFHMQPGHPLGFLDVSYAGELALAKVLADPTTRLVRLREQMRDYPAALAEAMTAGLWEAGFLLDGADKGARRGDSAYVALCVAKAVLLAAHALCARGGQWVTNEKGLLALAGASAPPGWEEQARELLGNLGTEPDILAARVARAKELIQRAQESPAP